MQTFLRVGLSSVYPSYKRKVYMKVRLLYLHIWKETMLNIKLV